MTLDPGLVTLLGGAALGAIFSGALKIAADYVKDSRDHRASHELDLRGAYEAWTGCFEEAYLMSLLHAGRAQRVHQEDQSEAVDDRDDIDARSFAMISRLGAARARLLLVEDSPGIRTRVAAAHREMSALLVTARMARGEKFKAHLETCEGVMQRFRDLVAEVAARRELARRAHRSVLPDRWHRLLPQPTAKRLPESTSGQEGKERDETT